MSTVDLQQFAAICKVTEKAVRDWIDAGMPVESRGSRGGGKDRDKAKIDLKAAFTWYFETNFERFELDRQRAGLAYEQRRKAALENAEQVGDLARISVIAKEVSNAVVATQALLLAIPTKEAPMVAPMTDANAIEKRLRSAITEALQQLAAYGARGTNKRSGSHRDGDGEVRTAPIANSKRVGRGKSPPQQ